MGEACEAEVVELPHAVVLAGRDRVYEVLKAFFPDDDTHDGARAHASNLAAGLAGLPSGQRWRAVVRSLRTKGLSGVVLEKAAMRALVAWSFAVRGV